MSAQLRETNAALSSIPGGVVCVHLCECGFHGNCYLQESVSITLYKCCSGAFENTICRVLFLLYSSPNL